MKKLWLVLLLPIVLFCSTALAQAENMPILINELSLSPIGEDVYWVEVYNPSTEGLDLGGWTLENSAGDVIDLIGVVNPESYLVVTWEEPFLGLDDQLMLTDDIDGLIDSWEFNVEVGEGQTLIIDDEVNLVLTDHATAGRANIFYEAPTLVCEEVEEPVSEVIEEEVVEEVTEEEPALQTAPLIISEIFANPVGSDTEGEFVEIFNPTSEDVNLEGWSIADASKSFALSDLSIQADSYLVISRTLSSIALNNTTETVTLTDPFDLVIDEYAYESSTEGLSWNEAWYEALPSPGLANNDSLPEEVVEEVVEEIVEEEVVVEDTVEEEVLDPNLDQILLNEFLPNPVGSDDNEWIELVNPTPNDIKLAGLILTDGSVEYVFESKTIDAGAFLVIPRSESGISLNNGGDTVSLIVDTSFSDQFIYEESAEGLSWARTADGSWSQTTSVTEGSANIVTVEEETEEVTTAAKKTASKKSPKTPITPSAVTFADWTDVEDEALVTIEGVISVKPGLMNKRTALLQSIDEQPPIVIELYFHKAEWPELIQGQMVTITGEKSVTQRGDRLLIRDKADILLSEIIDFAIYVVEEGVELDESLSRMVIEARGVLMEQRKNELLLDINGQEVIVDLKSQAITLDDIKERSEIVVKGLFDFDDKLSIMLFDKNDLEVIVVEEEEVQEETMLGAIEMEKPPIDWTMAKTIALSSILSTAIALLVMNREKMLVKIKDSLLRIRKKATV